MYVYRIEHATYGEGPYNTQETPQLKALSKRFANAHGFGSGVYSEHPRMFDDCSGWDGPYYKWYAGFSSAEQLIAWFPRELLVKLIKPGYKIMVYQVPDLIIRRGTYQCMFLKFHDRVKRIDIIEIMDFLRML